MRRPRNIIHALILITLGILGCTTAQAMSGEEVGKIAKQTTPTTIQRLIDAVAQYEQHYQDQSTPLHWAGWNTNIEVTKVLIAAGADVNARKNNDRTPLQWAGWYNDNPEVIKALIAAGADVHARNKKGRTPLHLAARRNRNPEAITVLRNGISAADRQRILAEIEQIRAELKGGGKTTSETVAQTQNTGDDGPGAIKMTLTDACADGRGVQYRIFGYATAQPQGQYIGLAPNNKQVFTLPDGGSATVVRSCQVSPSNKIAKSWCFGGTPNPEDDSYWGVGIKGDQSCKGCCGNCPSQGTAEFSYNAVCSPGAKRSYSSIADTQAQSTRGGWSVAYATGYKSEAEADIRAIELCQANGRGDCTVVHRFRGKGCAAIAKSNKGAGGWAGGYETLVKAEQAAVEQCNAADKTGNACRTTTSDCTDG